MLIKSSTLSVLPVFSLLMAIAYGALAQKAALYNFDFQVPDEFRREIQAYDGAGNKKYKQDPYSNEMILDKYAETLAKKEVNNVCQMAADMFKRKFGYSQLTILYPLDGDNGPGRLDNFPNLSFKKATKKLSADIYITFEIKIESKEPFLQWSDALEVLGIPDDERIMFIEISAKYTIYKPNEEIIDKKQLNFSDLQDEVSKYFDGYKKEVDEKGRFKLWKSYLTKQDITSIYKIVEQKLEAIE